MGTNKPVVQCVLDEDYFKKLKYLCEKNERSQSKMTQMIIKNYIDQYEKLNGPIEVKP